MPQGIEEMHQRNYTVHIYARFAFRYTNLNALAIV